MDKIGATALPKTWDEFNAMAKRFADAGILLVAHGGLASADAVQFEIVLAGISPIAYKKAIMELDDAALRGPEVLAALTELRQLTKWMSPSNAGQHWSVFAPNLMKGEYGFLMMGGRPAFSSAASSRKGRTFSAVRRRTTQASRCST